MFESDWRSLPQERSYGGRSGSSVIMLTSTPRVLDSFLAGVRVRRRTRFSLRFRRRHGESAVEQPLRGCCTRHGRISRAGLGSTGAHRERRAQRRGPRPSSRPRRAVGSCRAMVAFTEFESERRGHQDGMQLPPAYGSTNAPDSACGTAFRGHGQPISSMIAALNSGGAKWR